MKKILLTLFIFSGLFASAQTYNIPDTKGVVRVTKVFSSTDSAKIKANTDSIQALKDGAITFDPSEENSFLNNLQAMGSSIKALPVFMSRDLSVLVGLGLSNHEAVISVVNLPKNTSITGVKFMMLEQGNYTGTDYCGVGLYKLSGNTLTQVAYSASNTELFKAAANTMVSVPFTATYTATKGIYYILINRNSSEDVTVPLISGYASYNTITSTFDLPNGVGSGGIIYSGGTSLLPTYDITTSYNRLNLYWAALY